MIIKKGTAKLATENIGTVLGETKARQYEKSNAAANSELIKYSSLVKGEYFFFEALTIDFLV